MTKAVQKTIDLKQVQITEELHSRLGALKDIKNFNTGFHKFSISELACEAISEYLERQETVEK